jgi:hypothetical protein
LELSECLATGEDSVDGDLEPVVDPVVTPTTGSGCRAERIFTVADGSGG